MTNTLFIILSVLAGILAAFSFSDDNTGAGVFFGLVCCTLLAVAFLKSKDKEKAKTVQNAPKLMNGDRIAPISNPYPVTPAPVTPAPVTPAFITPAPVTPAPVRYAPNYAPTMNGMILYRHYRKVRIYTPENMLPNVSIVSRFDSVRFVPEPQNTYDPGAVRVMCGRVAIGYLYKNNFQEMVRRFLESSDRDVLGHIAGIEDGKVTIDEVFYKKSEPLFECTVSAAQDEIVLCEVGDVLPVSYDFEKETYIVGESGRIPKKFAEELDEDGYYIAIVTEIGERLKVAVYETDE